MKRSITLLGLMVLCLTAVMAATPSSIYKNAGNAVDDCYGYQAGKKDIEWSISYSDGTEKDSGEIEVTYEMTHYGRNLKVTSVGDDEVLSALNSLYTLQVLTPFDDAIIESDFEYLGQESVDGKTANVFSVDVAFDVAALEYGADESGTITGYDSDGDLDGSANMKIWVDATTGVILKQENSFSDLDATQSIAYTVLEDGSSVPSTVDTVLSYRTWINGKTYSDFILTAHDVLSGYFFNENA